MSASAPVQDAQDHMQVDAGEAVASAPGAAAGAAADAAAESEEHEVLEAMDPLYVVLFKEVFGSGQSAHAPK